jgi:FAD:protein FMN transferase
MPRALATPALLLAVITLLAGCDRNTLAEATLSEEIMGTVGKLTAVATDAQAPSAAVEAGFARLRAVNALMSDYRPDSEISRLNAAPRNTPVELAPETFFCLERAQDIAAATDGAFDITVRPLVSLWREAAANNTLPSDDQLAAVRQSVGYQKLQLNANNRTATLSAPKMQLDLGGIAKGYALDLAAQAMQEHELAGGLVDVGGDVYAFGHNADGSKWQVGIQHPFEAGLYGVLAITDRGVATSGLQQRFFEIDGRHYSHIIDPRTGRPTDQAPSVTVIAPTGLLADAWATAFSVMTVTEGQALAADHPDLAVLWLSQNANGSVNAIATPNFNAYRVR